MQKISRIYVGGYGIDMAWYDGVTFDLTDPASGEPTDTILNLENGGGKTTLLSFVFSCFDTPIERFLKHIQNKNHRFSQYFSRDGQPGIILIEWVMPPRIAGGKPYYLVIGQAVAVKTGIERDEVERIFFSFEANSSLSFESVPAPKLNFAPVSNMLELSRWIHEAHKLSTDFFQTRVQYDWQQHLREERLIDIDMLKLQVNFSAQEGGIDTGFLNFNSEPEFIRKFFGLTLDDGMAASVRQSVVDVCDKLRRKPHLQKCLTELSRLRTTLLAFKDAASLYSIASNEQDKTRHLGARLKKGLDVLASKFRLEEKEALVKQQEQSELAVAQSNLSKNYTAEITTLKLLQLTRTLDAIIERKNAAEITADTARDTLFRVNAAKAHSEITASKKRLIELGNNSIAAREQLEPWKDKVEFQGMLLRNALLLAEKELENQLRSALTTENQTEASLKNIEKQFKELETAARSLSAEESALKTAEEAYCSSLNQLINEDIIKEDESTSEALARYTSIAAEQLKLEKKYNLEAKTLKNQEQEARSHAQKAQVNVAKRAGCLPQLQKFVAEGESEREKFEQNSILRQVTEADTANPDSPILLPELERFILAEERSVAQYEVQLSTLHASRSAITQTGVAGDSCDVNKVVASLHAKGVKSAKPYNIYLADAIPDASTARAIVLSNPSRFLGVSVASSELESAREIAAQNLQLDTPVMVSVNSLEPDALEANRFVLSADNNAAFNREAAQALLQQLDVRIASIDSLRNAHASRLKEALRIREQLLAYAKRFGGDILARTRMDIERLQQESEAELEQSTIYEEQAKEYGQQAESAKRAENSCSQATQSADMHQKTISRFSAQHDASRPARLIRLHHIPNVRIEQDIQRVKLTTEQTNVTTAKQTAFKLKIKLEAKANEQQNERLAVTHWREDIQSPELLLAQHQTLEELRVLYVDAEKVYSTEANQRLGLLQYKEEDAQKNLTEQLQNFALKFSDLNLDDFAPYLSEIDFATKIQECSETLQSTEKIKNKIAHDETAARTACQIFQKENRPVEPATIEMVSLGEAALEHYLANTSRKQLEAAQAASDALTALESHKVASQNAKNKASVAEQATGSLQAALDLSEYFNVEAETPDEAFAQQATELIADFQQKRKKTAGTRTTANKAFETLKSEASTSALQEVEPDIASQLLQNEFEAACMDSTRHLEGLDDRIGTTQSSLDGMQGDFDACLGELLNLSSSAIAMLSSACANKRIPVSAPYVGGKLILKMRARFNELGNDLRRQHLGNYLDNLIDSKIVPAKGAELIADAVLRIHGKPLGLQMLKMVPDEALQYVAVDKIQNSGGEGVVMAMFLYMLINQLRAETQAKLKKVGGGPLILDNPFAKATTPTLWQAQRLLAQAMDVQLIFATALPDYNTVGEFSRFVRLRKAGKNTKTGRWHLEAVDFKLKEQLVIEATA